MTQVTGTLTLPDGTPAAGASVVFELVGADRAFVPDDDETVLKQQPTITTDENGQYVIDLPGNATLDPPGTRWRRTVSMGRQRSFSDDLIVPVNGGPYNEHDLLASPLVPVPSTAASNLIISSRSGADQTVDVANALFVYGVDGTTITIDTPLDFMVELRGRVNVRHEDEDFANVGLQIAPPGQTVVGGHVGQIGYALTGEKGESSTATITAQARLDPGITGSWQLYVTSFKPGDVIVVAGAELAAYRV